STKGNANPYTGEPGTKTSPPPHYGGDVHVNRYMSGNGTDVEPYWRTAPGGDPTNNRSGPGNAAPYSKPADATVVRLQRALTQQGEDVGPLDGVLRPRTLRALGDYARKQGATGLTAEEALGSLLNGSPEPTSPQTDGESTPKNYFTLGSTKDEVLRIQGEPRS